MTLFLRQESGLQHNFDAQINRLSAGWTFNFATWELEALSDKILYGLLSPQRFMNDEVQARFVLGYLSDVQEADRLARELDRIYTDPEITDPAAASQDVRTQFMHLRQKIAHESAIAEAILEDQVSSVLAEAGLGKLISVQPPVLGTFTPLPYVLVISPRSRIESVEQRQLVPGLTAAEQTALEDRIMEALPDHSAYVTAIGGLAAYPSMLLESSSIDWVADVYAHEWTHHYLTFYPLGWQYMKSSETRTINETTASLVGEWAGQEIILRYYAPLLERDKRLPDPLLVETADETRDTLVRFDFRAEMHETRVVVDELLAEERIEEAELYMEVRRRYFVEHGYRLRRLNQAYFAFHGAYASSPGAAGSDPIGPLVRQAWALSEGPAIFLRDMGPVTSLQKLNQLVSSRGGPGDASTVDVALN